MKIKVADLYDLSLGLADISDKELPIATSLKIHRNQQAVSENLISIEKLRQKIIDKYKEKEVEGGIKIKEGKLNDFHNEMDELMKQEIEVKLHEIKLDEIKNISIKAKTLNMLKTILNAE